MVVWPALAGRDRPEAAVDDLLISDVRGSALCQYLGYGYTDTMITSMRQDKRFWAYDPCADINSYTDPAGPIVSC